MEEIKPKLGFEIKYEEGVAKFVYEQAKHGGRLGCATSIFSLILAFVVTGILDPLWKAVGEGPMLVFFLGAFIGGPVCVVYFLNKKRGKREFTITPSQFFVDGKQFDRSHIASIEVAMSQKETRTANYQGGGTYIVGGTGLPGAAMVIGAQAGAAAAQTGRMVGEFFRSAIAKANAKITFRYGEETHVLAKGLAPERAEVLFEKVLEACDRIK